RLRADRGRAALRLNRPSRFGDVARETTEAGPDDGSRRALRRRRLHRGGSRARGLSTRQLTPTLASFQDGSGHGVGEAYEHRLPVVVQSLIERVSGDAVLAK